MTIRPGALLLNRRTGPEAGGAGRAGREAAVGRQGWSAEHDSIVSPRARPTVFTAAPNGWRLSGEGGEADRVRCSRGLGDSGITASLPGLEFAPLALECAL